MVKQQIRKEPSVHAKTLAIEVAGRRLTPKQAIDKLVELSRHGQVSLR